jgi:hypothetical protein
MLSAVLHLMSHYTAGSEAAGGCVKLASVIERHLKALAGLPELSPVLSATCQQLSEQWASEVERNMHEQEKPTSSAASWRVRAPRRRWPEAGAHMCENTIRWRPSLPPPCRRWPGGGAAPNRRRQQVIKPVINNVMNALAKERKAGSRRRRLWELGHACHCPLVGVGFPLGVLRKLVDKVTNGKVVADDYEVHVGAVTECGTRNRLSEALQKELERRYAGVLLRFRNAKSTGQVAELWRTAVANGDVAGAFWAGLTHPRCTSELEEQMCRDLHMVQHQAGLRARRHQQIQRHAGREQAPHARPEQGAAARHRADGRKKRRRRHAAADAAARASGGQGQHDRFAEDRTGAAARVDPRTGIAPSWPSVWARWNSANAPCATRSTN